MSERVHRIDEVGTLDLFPMTCNLCGGKVVNVDEMTAHRCARLHAERLDASREGQE